jgi:hypothetical protein
VRLEISPSKILFFSKRGFSKELLSMQSPTLSLYSAEDFSILLKNISKADIKEGLLVPN